MNSILKFFSYFQKIIAKNVSFKNLNIEEIEKIAFLDCGYKRKEEIVKCVCVVYNRNSNEIEKTDDIIGKPFFPYIPTFLFLREAPFMIELIERNKADLYVIDGHGLAHPRKSGIATVIGVLKNVSTIGIAKKFLYGKIYENKIFLDDLQVGIKFDKYYASIGNLVDIETIENFLKLFDYKYPWPMKIADKMSKEINL